MTWKTAYNGARRFSGAIGDYHAMPSQPTRKTCKHCGTTTSMRSNQKFCSSVCRSAYANNVRRLQIEGILKLIQEIGIEDGQHILTIQRTR